LAGPRPPSFWREVEEGFTVPLQMTAFVAGYGGALSRAWVEEGLTVPLRPPLRSTAFGGRLSYAGP
jgi:hypothetical protein